MNCIIGVFLISLFLARGEIVQGSVSKFTMRDFNHYMEEKSMILVFVSTYSCQRCDEDRWYLHKVLYNFLLRKEFFIFETVAGELPEFDKEFKVDSESERAQFLLFTEGSRVPKRHATSEDLADWISSITGIAHYPDNVIELTKDSYDGYFKKNPKRNVLVMFYDPNYKESHYVVANYYRNAYAFRTEYQAVFARVNCGKYNRFCVNQGIDKILEYKFIPAQGNPYDGEVLKSVQGEKITEFMNKHAGTSISGNGGLNESFGRSRELDVLAHQFMETDDIAEKHEILKKVVRLRKRPHAGRYYTLMKRVLAEGDNALLQERNEIVQGLRSLGKEDEKKYRALRGRENVLEQFRKIETAHQVHLDPWSFDYVVNEKNNVMMLILTKNCNMCGLYHQIYTNAATRGLKGVIFADLDGDKYPDFTASINVDPQVFMMWFKKGSSVSDGIPVTATTSIDSIFQFAKEHMDPEEKVEVEDHKEEAKDHKEEAKDHEEETEQDEVDL